MPNQSNELSKTIHLFGDILGRVLVEEEPRRVFDIEERIRALAKSRRSGDNTAALKLAQEVQQINPATAEAVALSFSLYFDLVNLAEEKQRVDVLRSRAREIQPGAPKESVMEAVEILKNGGVTPDEMQSLVNALDIELVLTAHPTEAKRRSVLSKLIHIYELVQALDSPDLLQTEVEQIETSIHAEIHSLWLTERSRTATPEVTDEIKTALYIVDEILWNVIPETYRDLEKALAVHYPGVQIQHPWLRLASWVGGDRDGNPNVTPQVTAEAIRLHRGLAVEKHRAVLRTLARRLSISDRMHQPQFGLAGWLESRRPFPSRVDYLANRYSNEPYRQAIALLADDLASASQENVPARLLGGLPGEPALTASDVERPLRMVAESLPLAIARDMLGQIRAQLKIFGLHTARLDIREDASVLRAALGEILRGLKITPDFEQLTEPEKLTLLVGLLESPRPELSDQPGITPGTTKTWALFKLVARIRETYGEALLGPFIISMTQGASDILVVFLLACWAGCQDGLDISPLFETVDDLQNAPGILSSLFALPAYRQHLETRANRQMVMIGYSDSNKDSGYLAANWALYRAQQAISGICQENQVQLTFFHGRGGTVARGGGPANRAIRAQPPGTLQGRFRMTVQGETIAAHYANPGLAHRNLEQMVHAVMLAAAEPLLRRQQPGPHAGRVDAWQQSLSGMSQVARQAYHALLYGDPYFMQFWQHATPLDEIRRLRIGSRPTSRPSQDANSAPQVIKIRAIPWVFSWMQSRFNIPGWYGLGTALEAAPSLDLLKEMYAEWPFFSTLVDNAEMSLLKADMDIAALYTSLVPDQQKAQSIFAVVRQEHDRLCQQIVAITGHTSLLDGDPTLQRSIQHRNPYIDPLNYIQVEMLRRLRALPDSESPAAQKLRDVIVLTINGISAGLRNTG